MSKILQKVPPGFEFTSVLDSYATALKSSPFNSYLILPTSRLIRTAKNYLIDNKITFISDNICTLNQFCEVILENLNSKDPVKVIHKHQAALILSELMHENKDKSSLFFCDGILSASTLSDLQTLISVFIKRKIDYPECLGEIQSKKSNQISSLYSEYTKKLEADGLVDSDTMLQKVISIIGEKSLPFDNIFFYGLFEPLPLEKDLITVMAESADNARYYMPYGENTDIFSDTGSWLNPDEIRPVSDEYKIPITCLFSKEQDESTISCSDISYAELTCQKAEIKEIAKKIRSLHDEGIAYDNMAVVFSDVKSSLSYVREVFSDYQIVWHSSSGKPISNDALISFFIHIADAVDSNFSYDKIIRVFQSPYFKYNGFSPADFEIICRTYGCDERYPDWDTQIERIISYQTGNPEISGQAKITESNIQKTLKAFQEILKPLKTLQSRRSIKEHISAFFDITSLIFGWNKNHKSELYLYEQQQVFLFKSILEELNQMYQDVCSFSDFYHMIRILMQNRSGVAQTGEAGVAVTGIREIVHQNFQYLFIASLIEGTIPKLKTGLPFMTARENSLIDTRSTSKILMEEQYYFIAALMAGKHLFLSYYQNADEKKVISSSFLDTLVKKCKPKIWENTSDSPIYGYEDAASIAGPAIVNEDFELAAQFIDTSELIGDIISRIRVEHDYRQSINRSEYDGIIGLDNDITAEIAEKYGKNYVWSTSLFESYISCPFCFYLERVLHIKPLPDYSKNGSLVKGTLVHNILYRFYRKMAEDRAVPLLPDLEDQYKEIIELIGFEESSKLAYRTPAIDASIMNLLGGRKPGILNLFINAEIDRLKTTKKTHPKLFTPKYLEFSFGMADHDDMAESYPERVSEPVDLVQIANNYDLNKEYDLPESILFSGKIDRVDITPDDDFGIVDYKTGKIPTKNDIKNGDILQIPLYILAFKHITEYTPVFGSYCQISTNIVHSICICDTNSKAYLPNVNSKSDLKWDEVMKTALSSVCDSVNSIIAGKFPIDMASNCGRSDYCPYKTICRHSPDRGSDNLEEGGQ